MLPSLTWGPAPPSQVFPSCPLQAFSSSAQPFMSMLSIPKPHLVVYFSYVHILMSSTSHPPNRAPLLSLCPTACRGCHVKGRASPSCLPGMPGFPLRVTLLIHSRIHHTELTSCLCAHYTLYRIAVLGVIKPGVHALVVQETLQIICLSLHLWAFSRELCSSVFPGLSPLLATMKVFRMNEFTCLRIHFFKLRYLAWYPMK